MIKTYAVKGSAAHEEYGTRHKRAEIPAGSAKEAETYLRGWFIVQGCDVSAMTFTVVAEGTFRAHMTRELLNLGARMSLRHGAVVVGPFEWEPRYKGDEPRSVMRLVMPNGWAVSLSSKLSDMFSVDTEMVTGHETLDGEWRTDFSAGVMEYESRIAVGEEWDDQVSEIIEGLAKLTD